MRPNPDLPVLCSDYINTDSVFGGFATKLLGDGRNDFSISTLAGMLPQDLEAYIVPTQTHSTNIAFIDDQIKHGKNVVADTDGVITKKMNVLLTLITADCVPIIYADYAHNIIGISHQGWRGSLHRMAELMIAKMLKEGASLDTLRVAIGPAINDCCYEIYGERYEEFQKEFSEWKSKIFRQNLDKTYINLQHLNYLQLLKAGVKPAHIDHFPFCTCCDGERFFSYKREGDFFGENLSFILQT
jgi:YfiH family protein